MARRALLVTYFSQVPILAYSFLLIYSSIFLILDPENVSSTFFLNFRELLPEDDFASKKIELYIIITVRI
jgi:hypothetical protein